MPATHPHAPLPIAIWTDRRPDGTVSVETYPARLSKNQRTPSDLPVLVNDLRAARESGSVPLSLVPFLLDIRELFSLTHPTSGADEAPVILGVMRGDFHPRTGARELASVWPAALERFSDWLPLLAETIVQILSAASPAWRTVAEAIAASNHLSLEPPPAPADDTPAEAPESFASSLVAKLRPAYDRPPKRDTPDPSTALPLDPDTVANILGPGGPCSTLVPGYEERPGQLEMTRAVTDAFNRSKHLVVEAGTGVGKSLAYLLPSILWSRQNRLPVVVSTNTKNLQTQLFEKDIPTLRRVLDSPFTAALIKGRMNYVCLRRLQHILERREAEVAEDEAVPFAKVLVWIAATPTGDLDELDRVAADGGPGGFSLRSRLPCPSDECGGRRCRFFSRCLLQRARANALAADLIVANHSLVFAESGGNQSVFPKYHQLVFDEAHNLEESATRHFTVEISPIRFGIALRRLWRANKSGGTGTLADFRVALQRASSALPPDIADSLFESTNDAILAADKVRTTSDDYFRSLAHVPAPGTSPTVRYRKADLATPAWLAIAPKLTALTEALEKLYSCLAEVGAASGSDLGETASRESPVSSDQLPVGAAEPPVTGHRSPVTAKDLPNQPQWEEALRALLASASTVSELQADLAFTTAGDDPDTVFWLTVVGGRPDRHGKREPVGILQAAPVDISQKLADDVFNVTESIILCSATLSVNGSFTFLAHRIGLDKIEAGRLLTCQATSPFDYTHQCHACVPLFLPPPDAPSYTADLAAFLVRLFRRTGGRALVLFTSYEMMRSAAQRLQDPLAAAGIQLLVQGTGASRDRLTRIFRRDISSVLLGTDSFWEGVDVMGESLSCVVLARLPFDSVGDPLIAARGERVVAEGGNSFHNYSLPNAIIKFRQGFGRLIRHRDDHGIVVITDRRLFDKGYGVHFRRNLPCPVRGHRTEDELFDAATPFLQGSFASP